MICFVTNLEMPCFRTSHPMIWLDTLKRLILAKAGVDSSDLSEINARFLVVGLNILFHIGRS
jgi:hypothetical protein